MTTIVARATLFAQLFSAERAHATEKTRLSLPAFRATTFGREKVSVQAVVDLPGGSATVVRALGRHASEAPNSFFAETSDAFTVTRTGGLASPAVAEFVTVKRIGRGEARWPRLYVTTAGRAPATRSYVSGLPATCVTRTSARPSPPLRTMSALGVPEAPDVSKVTDPVAFAASAIEQSRPGPSGSHDESAAGVMESTLVIVSP